MHRPFVIATAAALLLGGGAALAHHGWGSYDTAAVTLEGRIQESAYQNPHGVLKLAAADAKVWNIVLAPPSRMEARGLPPAMLAPGKTASVVGYVHRSEKDEMRAERITIDGKTVELR